MMNRQLSLPLAALLFTCAPFSRTAMGAAAPALNEEALKPALEKYLEDRGNFCLGKFDWPIAVSKQEFQIGSNNAVQMPVLEKLGLVAGSATDNPEVRQYALTEGGRKYYLAKRTVTIAPGDVAVEHAGDLCAAKLALDKVVAWQPPEIVNGRVHTTVKYTYKILSAAEWTSDPDVKRVFPMIRKIIEGEGSLKLIQAFAWSNESWVAIDTAAPRK
jgi:hypothetical protein